VRRSLAAGAVLLALSACEQVQSKDVRSSGIRANIIVRATAAGTSVTVTMTAGGITSITLDPGDSLTASGGGRTVTLRGQHFAGASAYYATLNGVTKPGVQITVALHRRASDTDAPHSVVTLPGPITVSTAARTYSRARDPIALRLNGDVGRVLVDWHGSCAAQESAAIELNGPPYAIPPGSIPTAASGAGTSSRCALLLVVTRTEQGKLDHALKGGYIRAERQAIVTVQSAP
jgi:hypothetical protein